MTSRLRIEHLAKRYGAKATLTDLSFTVEPGEIVSLLGPNGTGKSTTLRIVVGIQPGDAGKIWLDETEVTERPDVAKSRIGYVPQDAPLFERLSPLEMIELAGRLRGLSTDAARAHASDWLQRVGPRGSEQKRIAQLSGGQKQLVAIGCALAGNPSLLLLDEAYAGLDAAVMRRADEAIIAYRDGGGSVLMTSHQLDHVHRISDRVVVLHHGTVAATWNRAELAANIPAPHPTLSDLYLSVVGERDADS